MRRRQVREEVASTAVNDRSAEKDARGVARKEIAVGRGRNDRE